MGAVTLLVADLDGMTAYYRDAVALTVLPSLSDYQPPLTRGDFWTRHDPAGSSCVPHLSSACEPA
jgi:hypothetical protein